MKFQDIGLKTKIIGGGFIPIILASVLLVTIGFSLKTVLNSVSWVDQTHRMIRQTLEIQVSAMGMLAWLRAFLVTGDEQYATECKSREAKVKEELQALKKSLSGNPQFAKMVVEAEGLFKGWAEHTVPEGFAKRRAITAGKSMEHMVELVGSEQGMRLFGGFRALMQGYIDKRQAVVNALKKEPQHDSAGENSHKAQNGIERAYAALQMGQSIYLSALDMETGLRGFILSGKEEFLVPYTSGSQRAFNLLAQQKQTVAGDVAEEKLITQIQTSLETWVKKVAEPEIALRRDILASTQMSDLANNVAYKDTKQNFEAFDEALASFKKAEEELLQEREKTAEETSAWTQSVLLIGMATVILASLAISYLIARAIAKPLIEAVGVAEGISAGDLSRNLQTSGSDEVGRLTQAFNQMVGYLRDQTTRTTDGINVLASSASEISATVAELAASSSKTSSAVAETTTTVEQVKQAAKVSSDKARKVAETAQQSVQISETGKKATEDTLARMNLIKEQMVSIGETVVRLSEQSQAIEDIIATVQDLADQSNLLAVNASIEAARAGDQGKGFAVVAHEIKTLADQSKNATEQVRSILQDTKKWVSAVVMAAEQGGKAVEAGVLQSASAGDAISSLTNNVTASFQAASLIQSHTEQQFLGIEQVSTAMSNIDEAMRENVSSTAQLESAARRIEQLGVDLKELVTKFKI